MADRRTIFSWCMYDFANSAFSTLILTFIYSTYYFKVVAPDEITGTALWSRGLTVSALIVAFLSPFMGAVADSGGFRKRFLLMMTGLAVIATASLYLVLPGQIIKGLVLFVIANIGIEMGMVFYNAFLPDIAPGERLGRISGYGWSLGYVGGLLAMVVAMVFFITPEKPFFGLSQVSKSVSGSMPVWKGMSADSLRQHTGYQIVTFCGQRYEVREAVIGPAGEIDDVVVFGEFSTTPDTLSLAEVDKIADTYGVHLKELAIQSDTNIRAVSLLVAVWLLIFTIPAFLWLQETNPSGKMEKQGLIKSTLFSLRTTILEIRRYRQIVRFLLARLFYNDGLLTIFSFGSLYAVGTFGFSLSEILIFGIVLNITAGVGAFALGFLDDVIGGKRTIQITNVAFVLAVLIAVLAPGKTLFWIAGILIGLFSGPNQAASRSLMSRFIPADKETEFFGFYALSAKATAFIGPLLLGLITQLCNSQRAGIATLIVLFLLGIYLLHRVDEADGRRLSGR